MSNDMDFCHLREICLENMGKTLLDTFMKTGQDAAKTTSKKVVRKTAETTGELKGKKTDKKVVKPKRVI